jgi:HlyD family secretion protein
VRVGTQLGGQVKIVHVDEGTPVKTNDPLVSLYSNTIDANEVPKSPLDGVFLERLVEPGGLAPAGSTLVVVADLDALTLKVYGPEDRYGRVSVGDSHPVFVDSFPGETFRATVSHVADQALFTPRNLQTPEGRKSTVFAVTLDLAPSGGKLKPGMPADVNFAAKRQATACGEGCSRSSRRSSSSSRVIDAQSPCW